MVYKSAFRNNWFILTIFALISVVTACGPSEPDSITEGTIKYQINYPGMTEGSIFQSVLPSEMNMIFKGDEYVNEIAAAGMFDSKVIVDCAAKTVTLTFHFGGTKIYTTMNESVADSLLHEQFGIPRLIDVTGIEEIIGFDCKRSFAMFDSIKDGPDFEVKYTSDIALKTPNWCNQFKELDAVLMEYELKQYGMRLKMRANEFKSDPVDEKAFTVEDDYTLVSVAHIVKEFEKVFESFK